MFTTLGATLAWAMALPTGTPSRAATVGLIGLVLSQMLETLSDSRGPLVVATNVGTVAVMAGIISTPGVSQVFGCTPVGPVGWGQAVAAALIAGGVSALLPGVVDQVVEKVHALLVDGQDADADQDCVDVLDRGSEDLDAGLDERIRAHVPQDIGHVGQPNPESPFGEGLPN